MSNISKIHARQILDSRGNPTIEVDLTTDSGMIGRAAVPSGASTGSREALELRDKDPKNYLGKSVHKAIENIQSTLAPDLIGMDVTDQRSIDSKMLELDGTEYKSKLGANALLAISLAASRAAAFVKNKSLYSYLAQDLKAPQRRSGNVLPAPLMNIINGGEHASNNLDIQEFMIVPHIKASFSENLRAGVEIFHHLKKVLSEKGLSTNVGDEGGFAPNLESHEQAIELILKAIENAGHKPGVDVSLALDCAASEFYKDNSYHVQGKKLDSQQMIDYLDGLVKNYPIYSIEDGLAEQDQEGWTKMTAQIGDKVLTVGDDLFVTNKKILQKGIEEKQANSILVKVNQIGTLSETFDTIELAYQNNMECIISHRSGETGDTFISDLAVATNAGHIKTGSASRSDRLEKYNQLLRIEEELGNKAEYRPVK